MTVAELIKELSKLENQDARAVVRGYEGGVDDVDEITFMKISLDANKGTWYYGCHEEIYEDDKRHPLWSEDSNVPAYKIG